MRRTKAELIKLNESLLEAHNIVLEKFSKMQKDFHESRQKGWDECYEANGFSTVAGLAKKVTEQEERIEELQKQCDYDMQDKKWQEIKAENAKLRQVIINYAMRGL